ncbi:hypothetical protein PVAND_005225 [Polypedilum vanderplanki]|uniref:Uncharacterized protein n=1 Tax=Polypedilum vanderplanki TaxID=319348 RepID=A0A9J6BZY6_POLVA|nr:hypothetical protein PVAND_005225 [Polypedilum vanderplanki]
MKNLIGINILLICFVSHGTSKDIPSLNYNPQQTKNERNQQPREFFGSNVEMDYGSNFPFLPQIDRFKQPLKMHKHHSSSIIPSRVFYETNPTSMEEEKERINLERIFANDYSANNDRIFNNDDNDMNTDTLDEGIWLDAPIDIADFMTHSKKSLRRYAY